MKIFLLTVIFVCNSLLCIAQGRNNIWCFGDSALVDFNDTANILTGRCNVISRGSCASICDSIGQLLFYSSYDDDVYTSGGPPFNGGEIFTKQHQTMQNGDLIVMGLWYNEVAIVNDPSSTNLFYVISIGVTGNYGLFYSIVDMNANGGIGAVILKNFQLQNWQAVDGLTAIKHGNGRDWWILSRPFDNTNSHYIYFVSPSGIIQQPIQFIGSSNHTNSGNYRFNSDGSKLAYINYKGLIELYDFDRCTGVISNPVTFDTEVSSLYPQYWDCEFSPDGNQLYVTTNNITSRLLQYHLLDSFPAQTRDTIHTNSLPVYSMGALKRGPDGKIYLSSIWNDGINFPYPYPDSAFYPENMNLGVIHSPDSAGIACNFAPYSFYLGGARCYLGLPNNPDYEMKPLYGSACDSLSAGIENLPAPKGGELYVTYISAWEKAFINAQHLRGTTYMLTVTDVMGRIVFKERGKIQPPYFTKDLDCISFSKGMYIVTLTTNKEQLSQKFIRN